VYLWSSLKTGAVPIILISKKKSDIEIPQKRLVLREEDLNTTIRKAVWETAPTFFDQESLNLGISYSSVSKQVSNIKLNLKKESQIKKIFEKANSLFKM
jgi:hypothetical protein